MLDRYIHLATGLSGDQRARLHAGSRYRACAYALALPIPLLVWGVSSWTISSRLFDQGVAVSAGVSCACVLLVYCIERLIMMSPRRWYVSACRVALALLMAALGASTFDLILFDRESQGEVRAEARLVLEQRYAGQRVVQEAVVASTKRDWEAAEARKNCEADGTCGTGRRKIGPIWRELDRQAHQRRADFDAAAERLAQMDATQAAALDRLDTSDDVIDAAGLLARLEALHRYVAKHDAAKAAWVLLFLLMVTLEMAVLAVKAAFGTTLDDRVEQAQEALRRHQLETYLDGVVTPRGRAMALIEKRL